MVSNSTTKVREQHIIMKWLVGLSFVWILQGPFLWNYKLALYFYGWVHRLWISHASDVFVIKWTPRPPSVGWEGGCVIFFLFPLQRTGIFASLL